MSRCRNGGFTTIPFETGCLSLFADIGNMVQVASFTQK